ncbi:MAG: hypothetical protein ACTSYD_01325 [Candidatus Heimdallarchaeaceae archaeon]
MNFSIRRTDSLAYDTGTFKNIVGEIRKRWDLYSNSFITNGEHIIEEIKQMCNNQETQDQKHLDTIVDRLAKFGEALGELEKFHADRYDFLTELEGLEFPLKQTKKLISLHKKESDLLKSLETFAQNLSKTISFYENTETEIELIINSLKSFESTFKEYVTIVNEYQKTFMELHKELDEKHKKAQKYLDFV